MHYRLFLLKAYLLSTKRFFQRARARIANPLINVRTLDAPLIGGLLSIIARTRFY